MFIGQNGVDLAYVLCCAKPCGVGGSGTIQEDMYVILEIFYGPGFDRILLLVIGF